MKIRKNLYSLLIGLFCTAILFSSCGDKNGSDETASDDEGITFYYTIIAEGLEGGMKIARKGDDKFFWERTLKAEGLDMKIVVISDGKDVYAIANENDTKVAYKTSMDDYNKSIDKAQQICVINPGRTTGNFNKVGEETVLGESCSVYELPDGTTFVVSDDGKNIYNISIEGMEVRFTNNQTKPAPSDELFAIPTDVEFEETDDLLSKF